MCSTSSSRITIEAAARALVPMNLLKFNYAVEELCLDLIVKCLLQFFLYIIVENEDE